ncbi:hypothetical protein ACROYT_G033354 [Oculina patagonica]
MRTYPRECVLEDGLHFPRNRSLARRLRVLIKNRTFGYLDASVYPTLYLFVWCSLLSYQNGSTKLKKMLHLLELAFLINKKLLNPLPIY